MSPSATGLPERIGRYRVLASLGRGATSEVYLCRDDAAGRDIAIKVAYPPRLADAERGRVYWKLFIAEASLAGRLSHPNIVHIYESVLGDDVSYIVMEFVPGGTLEQYCRPENLLPIDKVVEIIFKCTRALDHAHRAGLTHRDIKPANILIVEGADIKISDFGAAISSVGDTTQVSGIGSPAYMSPQQIKEHPLDHRTDIYSLGVVMYQLLTGVLPFSGRNNFAVMYQITSVEPPPPSAHRRMIPAALDRIVKRAIAKDLDDRYATWDEFSFDLADTMRSGVLAPSEHEKLDAERFATLRKLAFFAEFGEAELWEVMRMSSWEDVPAGVTLMRESEPADRLCVLAAGNVKVTKGGKLLNVLGAGECFGELAQVAGRDERSADVATTVPSRLVTVRYEALARVSDACRVRFEHAFTKMLAERLLLSNQRLEKT